MTNQCAFVSETRVGTFGIGSVFEHSVVGFAIIGNVQAQFPPRNNFGAGTIEGVRDGGEVAGNKLGARVAEIAVVDESLPGGIRAVLGLVIEFGVVDGLQDVTGKTVALVFAAGRRKGRSFLRIGGRGGK